MHKERQSKRKQRQDHRTDAHRVHQSISLSQLCEQCRIDIFNDTWLQSAYEYWTAHDADYMKNHSAPRLGYITTWRALRARAVNNCRWCLVIHDGLERHYHMSQYQVLEIVLKVKPTKEAQIPAGLNILFLTVTNIIFDGLSGDRSHNNSVLLTNGVLERDGEQLLAQQFVLTTDEKSALASVVTARLLRHVVQGDILVTETLRWLAKCQSHLECGSQDEKQLPSRVVDVQGESGPKLVITRPGELAHYISLSYCWGGAQEGILTSANFQQYTKSIDTSRLSQTVRDAISTVKDLGFRYLWIDALCIIQDSDMDKAREIGTMTSVYQNCLFTLTIASGISASHSFLEDRRPAQVAITVRAGLSNGVTADIVISFTPTRCDMDCEPLQQRAWTYQEWMLSRRRLIFGTDTVKW